VIWVVGSKGMLAGDILEKLDESSLSYVSTDLDVDIIKPEQVESFIKNNNIKWIVNCAAYTAVDKAEQEKEKAFLVNAEGVKNLAAAASKFGAKVIHFSTDYVFKGDSETPYVETDKTSPESVYGETKLKGELFLQKVLAEHFIIRISWLYGIHGNNFVKIMLKLFAERDALNIVADQIGSPTYAKVLAENVVNLIKGGSEKYGIYHYSDEGKISWYDFAQKIKEYGKEFNLVSKNVKLTPIPTLDYPTPAKRPAFSLMSKDKAKRELKFKISSWEDNLYEFFKELSKS